MAATQTLSCVVDAATLINGIHELKQLTYDGSIRIFVPSCAMEQLEEAYKVSLIPKENKEVPNKRYSGKPNRREQPLFDINPRTAKEFLGRAQVENGVEGVRFQQDEQEFLQWKDEEKEAPKPESPLPAPSGYADALLRKLNLNDGPDANGIKGPSKPRLVARSTEPKSPWKYHKVPTIPSKNIPQHLKPLFSYVLWLLYDHENDPLMPPSFTLLTATPEITAAATNISIPVLSLSQIWRSLAEKHAREDHRMTFGELELEFPGANQKPSDPTNLNGEDSGRNGAEDSKKEDLNVVDHKIEVLNEIATSQTRLSPALDHPKEELKPMLDTASQGRLSVTGTKPVKSADQILEESLQDAFKERSRQAERNRMSTTPPQSTEKGVVTPPCPLSINEAVQMPLTPPPTLAKFSPVVPSSDFNTVDSTESVKSPVSPNTKRVEIIESDLDSDEEIIVFNPRARRASARSRPTTSSGLQTKRTTEVALDRPTTSNGQATPDTAQLKPKLASTSTLKPQSPSFTPGQLYISSHEQAPTQHSTGHHSSIPGSPPKKAQQPQKSQQQARQQVPPRQPRSNGLAKRPTPDQLQAQRQSELILQRQREAIERQAKTAAKPPPRKVQMEPTNNPTVIDPDAFDRSYVVQTPNNTQSNAANAPKRRSTPRRRASPKGDGKADSSKRESPTKHASKPSVDPDVEFVLKSGAPRGSTRGKGKLWIP